MIEVFKITNSIHDPLTTNNLLTFEKNSKTRSNGFKIVKVQTNSNPFKNFFTNRIVNSWNSLPASVVSSETVNSFKNALDRHLIDLTYKVTQ